MMKFTKLAAAIALASSAIAAPAMAEVELSATAGLVSDYVFRGVNLGDAAAYGSVDAGMGGFYAGVWTIDTNETLEVDYYLGYGTEFDNGFGVDVSYTYYDYTTTSYNETEVALGLSYAGFGFSYVDGEAEDEGATEDYTVTSLSYGGEVFGATYGRVDFDQSDFQYDWAEVTASGEVAGLDAVLALGKATNTEEEGESLSGLNGGYITLDISKSFDL